MLPPHTIAAPTGGVRPSSTTLKPCLQVKLLHTLLLLGLLALAQPGTVQSKVIFNEIHYHPTQPVDGPEPVGEEFIELFNAGTNVVDLTGWHLTGGIDYTFGAVSLPASGYLVIVSDLSYFQTQHPNVAPVLGNWVGKLGNRWQTVELVDAGGISQDRVSYATQGDWAVRRKGPSLAGTRGWEWVAQHDGLGRSLELIQAGMPNAHGQNWGASLFPGGTPGSSNSIAASQLAPMVLDVVHSPAIPSPNDAVTVRARLLSQTGQGLDVRVYYRNASTASPGPFAILSMADDGSHDDGAKGDLIFAAQLPAQTNRAVVEFYVQATDSTGLVRTWPAPTLDDNNQPVQIANALYQVEDASTRGTQPVYRLIMTEAERVTLATIANSSDAAMNATFIAQDDSGEAIRYLAAVRLRGAGSRAASVKNHRVGFPNDQRWNGYADVNLNTQYTYLQLAGSRLARKAGLAIADARAVQVRINGRNLASTDPNSPQNGSYVMLEPFNGDWADKHFPLDGSGNLFRASIGNHAANLSKVTSKAQALTLGYSKTSNVSEDDWTPLFQLTAILNDTPDESYASTVRQWVNVEEWMRYFAFMTVVNSMETSLASGTGDDYSLYQGLQDKRFQVLVHDLDTICGLGDTPTGPNVSIFRMVPQVNSSANTRVLNRFMLHPDFVPLYYRELLRMINEVFSPSEFAAVVDSALGSWTNPDLIASMKNFQAQRNAGVLAQIPQRLTLQTSLVTSNGFPYTREATVSLNGLSPVVNTRAVMVNGATATWTAWNGNWVINGLTLQPGINRVTVRSLDASGTEIARASMDIWRDTDTSTTAPAVLPADTLWTAAQGPYLINTPLTIPAGRTLQIEQGASVFMSAGSSLTVSGTLIAAGSDTNRIRFARRPGSTGTWGGIQFSNSATDNRIAFVDFDGAEGGNHHVGALNSRLNLEGCTWSSGGTKTILELVNSSAWIHGNQFPDLVGAELIHGGPVPSAGFVLIEDNVFGRTTLLNDIIDFTGARRPGPTLHIRNNIFTGASDDVLDLDGTDALIEGNLFMHVHKDNPNIGDTSSAISYGADGGYAPHVVAARNFFYDVDHAVLCKEGGSISLFNNTVVGVAIAAVNFSEPERGTVPGARATLEGNLFWNPPGWTGTNFQNRFPTNGTVQLTARQNLLLPGDTFPSGSGNFIADPQLMNTASNAVTAAGFREALALKVGSPASGRGPNGIDLGAAVPAGASLSGEPASPTASTQASLSVAGPAISHYRFKLDAGTWSEERPVLQAIVLTGLSAGVHQVSVLGRTLDGDWQAESTPTLSQPWEVRAELPGVMLSEIMARNDRTLQIDGEFPDWVELVNPSAGQANLAGYGLTTDTENPFRFTFPAGTLLPSGGRLMLLGGKGTGSNLYLGFNLQQTGDSLHLFDPQGQEVDAVTFGLQIADRSIARDRKGKWQLADPTPGSDNSPVTPGSPHDLLINEWMANGVFASGHDFVELFNPSSLPVELSGLHLSDEAVGNPTRHTFPPLSFMEAGAHVAFSADGDIAKGADHLSFKLASEQGSIGLIDRDLSLIDCVIYGPQSQDRSEGRRPSGASAFAPFETPTPGSPNPTPTVTVDIKTEYQALVALQSAWRYDQSGSDQGTNWVKVGFDDSTWSNGPALFGVEPDFQQYPIPFATPWTISTTKFTYYLRTHFSFTGTKAGVRLISTNLLDDGAVYYLNGKVAAARRMTITSAYDYKTRANAGSPVEGAYEVFDLSPDALVSGDNVLAVEVHQASPNSTDIAFAMSLTSVRSTTNIVGGSALINEVLASNSQLADESGETPDWVELYNPTQDVLNLEGFSLSDDPQSPRRWVFPPGVVISPRGFLSLQMNPDKGASLVAGPVLNTGFGLNDRGDRVLLYNAPAKGGGLLDSVTLGIQAADFSIGRFPDGSTNWMLLNPTFNSPATNRPATLGPVTSLRINEWMANPKSGDDWFEIHNPEAQPVALGGLYLTDDLGDRTKSPIPPLSFIGAATNGFVRFFADSAPEKGAEHTTFKLSNGGESLGLYRAGGIAIDTLTFGPQQQGVSQGRLPDGSPSIVFFPGTASPGENNYQLLKDIVISEALAHTDPPLEDAIEIQNTSDTAVDLGGWFLSDSAGHLRKFRIPEGTTVAPGGFHVFYEVELNPLPGTLTSFSLSSTKGDQVYLTASDLGGNLTGLRAEAKFGASQNGVSFGRYETSVGVDYPSLLSRSFGRDNPATTNEFHLGQGASNGPPLIGPIVINEIHYHPPDIGTNDNVIDEFIELKNIAGTSIPLYDTLNPTNTWRLRDAVDYEFPAGKQMAAGSILLLTSFDPQQDPAALAAFRSKYSVPADIVVLGPYRGKLDNGSDKVELYKPDFPQLPPHPDAGFVPYVLVDRVHYTDTAPWASLADGYKPGTGASLQRRVAGAYGNEPTNWIAGIPSPGRANGVPLVEPPVITTQPKSVTLPEGVDASLSIVATGAGPLSYQWRLGAEPILNATNATLLVKSTGPSNTGPYSVVVANPGGAVLSRIASLKSGGSPFALSGPDDVFAELGGAATFTVSLAGTQPMKLLWLHEGTPIALATNSSLTLSPVKNSDAGGYQLWASNSFGTFLTDAAVLTLGERPRITAQPEPQTALVGTSASFTLNATGTPPLSYQWFFKGIPLASGTQKSLVLQNVSLAQEGEYQAILRNDFGSVTSSPVLLTVLPLPALSITSTVATASESGGSPGVMTVTRSYASALPLKARYTVGGTARSGADYQTLPGEVIIPANALSVSIPIQAIEDPWVEGPETVEVILSVDPSYTLTLANKATVTILDNDQPPGSEGTNVVGSIAMTNVWRYHQTADLTATNWKMPGYDDSAWPAGPGALYVENDVIPVPKSTPLSLGRLTYYFRTQVDIKSTNLLQLSTSLAVDDGAVIYLNGQEAYRLGMRDGAVTYSTSAQRSVGNAKIEGPFSLPTTNAVAGLNVIAVEVHQFDAASTDIVFGMTLEAVVPKPVVPALGDPIVSTTGEFQFILTGGAGQTYTLERSTNLIDWVSVRSVILPVGGALGIREPAAREPGAEFFRATLKP